jgi:hypothetical protein
MPAPWPDRSPWGLRWSASHSLEGKQRPHAPRRGRNRPQRDGEGWLPLQNGTEGSGPVASTVGGNPATAVCARGSSSQWSTGCSLEEATHGTKPLVVQDELLRKEVIQPHLPVRLPCYDFTPIADPTFDGSLLAVGPPASGVTNFRGVTGGVYKARERIHPGVADPGLLATPTSWSRVADSNPN